MGQRNGCSLIEGIYTPMQIIRDIREATLPGPTFLTIGNFDGLHRGHQMLLERLRQQATAQAASSALLTFDPHPLTILRPHLPLALLTTPQERLKLAADQGIDLGVLQPFTPELAQLEPRAFLQLLVHHLGLIGLTVGPDFALGRNRGGNLHVLAKLGEEMGVSLDVVEPVRIGGEEVRSDAIRQALRDGQVERASGMLGRDYSISGRVVHGDQRGRTIGIPTANLSIAPERLLPADGVYATWVWADEQPTAPRLAGVTNIGMRPTVGGTERRVECHIFDFPAPGHSDDLYGKTLSLAFVQRLRGEERFDHLDSLIAQIRRDMITARAILQTETDQETISNTVD